jgi:hypothetical protein
VVAVAPDGKRIRSAAGGGVGVGGSAVAVGVGGRGVDVAVGGSGVVVGSGVDVAVGGSGVGLEAVVGSWVGIGIGVDVGTGAGVGRPPQEAEISAITIVARGAMPFVFIPHHSFP